jgi:hypothetical protein
MVDFLGELLSNDVVTVGRLLHRCYNLDLGSVTGLWYFDTRGVKSNFVAWGDHQQEPEGQYEKSVVHVGVPPGQVP